MSEDIKSQVLREFGNYLHKIIEFFDSLDFSEIKFHVGELERILKKGKRREIYLRKFRARGERMRRNKIYVTIRLMDFLAVLAGLNCFVSPALFAVLAWLAYTYFRFRSSAHQEKVKLENRIALINRTSLNAVREAWFEEICKQDYANELEVEVKFVYPLIRYLGYNPSDLRIRVPMLIRAGRNDVQGTADSVLYRNSQPVIVIEVKAPGVPLNENAKLQARSYCLALKVSTYILINGKSIVIYRRGLDSDEKIFESSVEQLPSKWSELYELIGVQA